MSFLQAVEVWIPEGAHLRRSSAAYGDHADFASSQLSSLLHKGEGLAGSVYGTGRPEVWRELPPPFSRPEPAQADALEAAVALPFYMGNTLVAVTVFLCGTRAHTSGCVELWEPNDLRELAHVDGYYGNLTAFENLSRVMRFQAGSGLPGVTWQKGLPMIATDLGYSSSFLRASAARELGIQSGLSLPLYKSGKVATVALFLSLASTPLARAFEIWMLDPSGQLRISEAFYEPSLRDFGDANRSVEFAAGVGLVGKVYEQSLPLAVDLAAGHTVTGHVGVEAAQLRLALGIPIHDGRRLRAVVVLLA